MHTYIHKLAASGDVDKVKEVLAENPTLVRYIIYLQSSLSLFELISLIQFGQ